MGLDIYVHRIEAKFADERNFDTIYSNISKDAKSKFAKKIAKYLKELKSAYESPLSYHDTYKSVIARLSKDKLYKEYAWLLDKYRNKILSIAEIEAAFESEIKMYYKVHDAYFRKVNFIYAYFQNILVDEICLISADDLAKFIDVCKKTLKENSIAYAKENLPTQSGFFFGSTAYDEWYWNDIKDCISQMSKVHKSLKNGDKVLIVFSW